MAWPCTTRVRRCGTVSMATVMIASTVRSWPFMSSSKGMASSRQATVGLVKREHRFFKWQVSDVCGVANARFGREWPEIAKQLEGLCNVREMVRARREAASRSDDARGDVDVWRCQASRIGAARQLRSPARRRLSITARPCGARHPALRRGMRQRQAQAYRVVIENRYAWKTYGLDRYEHFG